MKLYLVTHCFTVSDFITFVLASQACFAKWYEPCGIVDTRDILARFLLLWYTAVYRDLGDKYRHVSIDDKYRGIVGIAQHYNSATWHSGKWEPSFVIFEIRQLSPERQSARMSKITYDGLTRSGTGCFIAVPIWQLWASKGYFATLAAQVCTERFFELQRKKWLVAVICPRKYILA